MADPNKCPECGKWKEPHHRLCNECFRKQKVSRGKPQRSDELLPECIFHDSFLNEKGFPKKEIYQEASEVAAHAFENARTKDRQGMSQKSIRSVFQMLKAMEIRLRTDKDIPEEEVFDVFYRMERQVAYQEKREIVPRLFLDFVDKHKDLATKSKEEFLGFVEYLTSVMARMKTK